MTAGERRSDRDPGGHRTAIRFERTDHRIGQLEDRCDQMRKEIRDVDRRVIRIEIDFGLLPIRIMIAILWLLVIGFCVATIGTGTGL